MPLTDSAPTLTPHKHARTARCRLLVLMWFGVFLFSLVPLCVQCVLSICFLVCVRLLLFSPSLPCPAFVSVHCLDNFLKTNLKQHLGPKAPGQEAREGLGLNRNLPLHPVAAHRRGPPRVP